MKRLLKIGVMVLFGAILFIGLPLLGWGISDAGRFFHHPARALYVILIVLLQVFSVCHLPKNLEKKENRKEGVAQHKLDLMFIQIFSLLIVFIAPYTDSHAIGTAAFGDVFRYIGLILVAAGFMLMQSAEKYLDKQFSVEVTIQEGHTLVTSGPYKLLRHPRYLGIFGFFLGISLVFASWVAMAVVIALLSVLVWRIFAEESLLHQEFGQEWEKYCTTSWRLLPFVF